MKLGYARVCTTEQNLDRQIDRLTDAGCERIFQEKVTGTKKVRPELDRVIDQLRQGDTIIIPNLQG